MNYNSNKIQSAFTKYLLRNNVVLLGMLSLLIIGLFLSTNTFATAGAIRTILINMTQRGVLAIGVSLVILTGNIDLSVGSIIGVSSILSALIFSIPFFSFNPASTLFGIFIVLIIGGILGSINGLFAVSLGINSIIVTLATMAIFRGLAYTFLGGNILYITNPFYLKIGRTFIGDIVPATVLMLFILFLLLFVFVERTKFGRNFKVAGANEKVAFTFGIKVKNIKFIAFIISGVLAALSGIIMCSQIGAGAPEYGKEAHIDAIIIPVIGGFSLKGGKGNISGLFIALIIIEVFTIGFVLLGWSFFLRQISRGVILIIVLVFDVIREKKLIQVQ